MIDVRTYAIAGRTNATVGRTSATATPTSGSAMPRTRTGSAEDTVPVDDDQFGIDLGPPRNEPEPVEIDEALPPPVKPATKTLSERLAAAAADRDDADTPHGKESSPET